MVYNERMSLNVLSSYLQEDIFQQPGLRIEFAEIRDCLDTGMPESLCILSKL